MREYAFNGTNALTAYVDGLLLVHRLGSLTFGANCYTRFQNHRENPLAGPVRRLPFFKTGQFEPQHAPLAVRSEPRPDQSPYELVLRSV